MGECRHVITQGDLAVSDDPNVVISTLLGSCVACCLWDPQAGIGGMNHMLLARRSDPKAVCNEAGVNAMELLINEILKRGGARERLVAKVFGGAQMIRGLSDIGAANCEFTLDFLKREKLRCVSKSVGGQQARHVLFSPVSGVVRQKFVPLDKETEVFSERVQPCSGLELF